MFQTEVTDTFHTVTRFRTSALFGVVRPKQQQALSTVVRGTHIQNC